jgi:hypothetical protein
MLTQESIRPDFDAQQLWRLADLIAGDDSSLPKLQLEPDHTFQTRGVTCESVAKEVVTHLRGVFSQIHRDDLPHLYYGCGRARGGSTALTNVFGIAGIPSYYQPVKSVLRHVLSDNSPVAWRIGSNRKHVFAKETFGPYTLAECLFQPLDLLIESGYAADKIHLIVFDREPTSALASWLARWSHRVAEQRLVFHFVLAGLNALRVARSATRHGVETTTYVYELSRDPVFAVGKLFERLAIPSLFNEASVSDWDDRGDLASERSSIIFPDEPQIYDVPGLHGSDVAYRFHGRPATAFPDAYASLLADLRVGDSYRRSIQSCIADLGIDRDRAQQIFGHDNVEGVTQ